MPPVLSVKNLTKRYGEFVVDLSFDVHEREVLAFLGPNGAGKSTMILSLLNAVRRDAGDIRIFDLPLDQNEVPIKQSIGMVFDEPRLFRDLTTRECLDLFAPLYPTWDRTYVDHLLVEFDIDVNKRIKHLSKGMRVKVGLALALAPKPKLLILDEPTSGLDPGMRRLFVEKVREAQEAFAPAILLTSHILKDVEDLADRVAFLYNGRIKTVLARADLDALTFFAGSSPTEIDIPALYSHSRRQSGGHRFSLVSAEPADAVAAALSERDAVVSERRPASLDDLYDLIVRE